MLFPPPPPSCCAFLWCAANVIPAITAAYPNGSDKIINVTKPPSPGTVYFDHGSPIRGPCRLRAAHTSLLEQLCTYALQLTNTHRVPYIHTHRDTHGTAKAEQRQKTGGTPRRLVSALRYTNGSSRCSLSRNTWSADPGLCGLSV